ncbi:hypothetical protein MKX03_000008 [Papaver bracteatum]|nr:hypothetical protein MKX03_000008 [Papaver bracteatum]
MGRQASSKRKKDETPKRKKDETNRKSKKLKSVVVAPEDELFNLYANKETDMIEPDGVELLCSDLGIEHTDVRILMFAWKMSAAKMGYFTREEWQNGLAALAAKSMTTLSKALTKLEKKVNKASETEFLEFYSYAFQYCLTDGQRDVEKESICELLDMLLGSWYPAQVGKLVEYLKFQTDYKVISKDQWMGFYRFCTKVSFPGMKDYDEDNGFFPLIIDNFVEWMKEGKN